MQVCHTWLVCSLVWFAIYLLSQVYHYPIDQSCMQCFLILFIYTWDMGWKQLHALRYLGYITHAHKHSKHTHILMLIQTSPPPHTYTLIKHMHTQMHTLRHTHTCTHKPMCTYVLPHAHTRTRARTRTHMHECMHKHTCTCTHAHRI